MGDSKTGDSAAKKAEEEQQEDGDAEMDRAFAEAAAQNGICKQENGQIEKNGQLFDCQWTWQFLGPAELTWTTILKSVFIVFDGRNWAYSYCRRYCHLVQVLMPIFLLFCYRLDLSSFR